MNETSAKQYKSPRRKLVKFFEKSRDQWKRKCSDAKAMVKRQNNRIRFLEASKEQWKTKALELEKELARLKVQANQASQQQAVKKTMK